MPRSRRPSEAQADTRPAFARPPGARTSAPAPRPTQNKHPRRREPTPEDDLTETSSENEYDDEPEPPPRRRRGEGKAKESPAVSPIKTSPQRRDRERDDRARHKRKISEPPAAYDRHDGDRRRNAKHSSGTSSATGTGQTLSLSALSKLNEQNDLADFEEARMKRKAREKQYKALKADEAAQKKKRKKNRDVSGAIVEEGRGGEKSRRRSTARAGGRGTHGNEYIYEKHERRDTRKSTTKWTKKKKWLVIIGVAIVLLILIIAIGVAASKKKSDGGGSSSSGSSNGSSTVRNTCSSADTPASAKGTYYDISTWLDTSGFNCTYTDQTVGGLPIMGLNTTYDDSASANSNTPALNKAWQYGTMPVRGTNVGGWLNLEPFIAPSLFQYPSTDNVVDEWTLCQKLGSNCASVLENHYANFITKSDFAAIQSAGLDHVRIPFGYWAVTTYSGDPYVPMISWRYLLRAIEWCREYGLRVNLDLHGVPGSQNGWAHSGHQGTINWLNGVDGDTNGQRSLDIHNQLSQFFAQPRYTNVVTMYGLVNEPKMIAMDTPSNVIDWNEKAISLIRGNGIKQKLIFGDGFEALTYWNNTMKNVDSNLMLDTHQYQIFDVGELKLTHQNKINLVCSGWYGLITTSNNATSGWGPTINGEFSQADTDCTPNLNDVGAGSRWAGNLDTNTGSGAVNVNTPSCASPPCSCAQANADASQYSTVYKQFLKMYAEAQMHVFEQAQGWFYWTWKTESAVQWSYKLGLQAGILPTKAYQLDFKCDAAVPSFSGLSESY